MWDHVSDFSLAYLILVWTVLSPGTDRDPLIGQYLRIVSGSLGPSHYLPLSSGVGLRVYGRVGKGHKEMS